jgi:predicted ATPase
VLDNFEQVVEAAPQVSELLAAAPEIKMIVTSRQVLSVRGENVLSVPPLDLPVDKDKQTVAVLTQYEAIRLFIERGRAVSPDFEVTEENAATVVEICLCLDGLPLAIELAAARLRLMSPELLLAQLCDRLQLEGLRDLPARQRTLQDTIAWSYDLLEEDEKVLYTRLGVFSGGWSLEAAEQVCGGDLQIKVEIGLISLLDKNLVQGATKAGRGMRFNMLETIREFAVQRLEGIGESAGLNKKHAAYFNTRLESIGLKHRYRKELMDAIVDDYNNCLVAIHRALACGNTETALRITSHLMPFWHGRERLSEGRLLTELALRSGGEVLPRVRGGH